MSKSTPLDRVPEWKDDRRADRKKQIHDLEFEFKAPEGAQQIEFITNLDRSQ